MINNDGNNITYKSGIKISFKENNEGDDVINLYYSYNEGNDSYEKKYVEIGNDRYFKEVSGIYESRDNYYYEFMKEGKKFVINLSNKKIVTINKDLYSCEAGVCVMTYECQLSEISADNENCKYLIKLCNNVE